MKPGYAVAALVEVADQTAARMREHRRRRERRAHDRAANARDERRAPGRSRGGTAGAASRSRSPSDASRVESMLAERGDVGGDDDAARGARELVALRVDDRAARADEVDGAVRLPVRERRVLRAVEDLDRPGAQHEEAERDPDDDRQTADPHEEPGLRKKGASAREYGCRPRGPGEVARERHPAARIRGGDGYGRTAWSTTRPAPVYGPIFSVGRRPGGSLFLGELVRQQGQAEAPPGELRVGEQRVDGLRDRAAARRPPGPRGPLASASRRSGESSSPASRSTATES